MHNSYPVYLLDDSKEITYTFQTDVGDSYLVKFEKSSYYFNPNCEPCKLIYSLSFYPIREKKQKKDPKIRNTIIEIVERFIIKYDCPILYICDSSDQKETYRSKLFQKWYNECNQNDEYSHDFRVVELQDYTFVVGVIAQSWDMHIQNYLNELDFDTIYL